MEKPPTVAQQQADALALVAESALHHALDPGAPGERYQVVVHVDAAVLADPDQPGQSLLEDGAHVSAETSRRLTCDASRTVMRHGKRGHVVAIGARTRTIPPGSHAARSSIGTGAVAFPGAAFGSPRRIISTTGRRAARRSSRISRCYVAGITARCTRRAIQVARGPDGTLQFRRPDGRPLPEVPPPAVGLGDSEETLRARHDAEGLRIDARTAHPDWLGERLDLGWAIDVLHPKANRAAARDSM